MEAVKDAEVGPRAELVSVSESVNAASQDSSTSAIAVRFGVLADRGGSSFGPSSPAFPEPSEDTGETKKLKWSHVLLNSFAWRMVF